MAATLSALALAACAPQAVEPTPDLQPAADLPGFFDCVREARATLISAHRGGYGPGLPENSIQAFEASVARGVVLLETDIRQTADGVLVLMHDETLERTTTGEGEVARLPAADIKAVRLEDEQGQAIDAGPPTLDEALAWAKGRAILQLDVKRDVPFEPVVEAVRRAGAQDRVVIITYSAGAAARVHQLAPELMISASIASAADLAEHRARGIDPARLLAWTGTANPDPAFWRALRAEGVEPMFGTLGGRDSLDRRFADEGDDGAYLRLVEDGALTVIGTNRAPVVDAVFDKAGLGEARAVPCGLQGVID